MGVGIIRIQQGFDSSLFTEEEPKNSIVQTPEPQLRRNRSYSQMSQGEIYKQLLSQ